MTTKTQDVTNGPNMTKIKNMATLCLLQSGAFGAAGALHMSRVQGPVVCDYLSMAVGHVLLQTAALS